MAYETNTNREEWKKQKKTEVGIEHRKYYWEEGNREEWMGHGKEFKTTDTIHIIKV